MFLSEWREFSSAPCLAGGGTWPLMSRCCWNSERPTCFRACFLPGRTKELSASRYDWIANFKSCVLQFRMPCSFVGGYQRFVDISDFIFFEDPNLKNTAYLLIDYCVLFVPRRWSCCEMYGCNSRVTVKWGVGCEIKCMRVRELFPTSYVRCTVVTCYFIM